MCSPKNVCLIGIAALFCMVPRNVRAEKTDTITQYGITWKLSEPAEVGQFVTGDYYVVGACEVVSIAPPPGNGRNGCELNPPLDDNHSGYDDREEGHRYDAKMCTPLPIRMKPGDALVSTISVTDQEYKKTTHRWLRKMVVSPCPVKSACVLTCLAAPVPADAFRPSYCDRSQKIYLASHLKRSLLPSLPYGRDTVETDLGPVSLKELEDHYSRVWLDLVFFSFDAPVEYQPQYGRELAEAPGLATLFLETDLPPEKKEKLLIGVVQNGIDLWGIVRAGFHGWQAHGGHGSGRKWPIVFAGMMLGDDAMASPTRTYPNVQFGEDMQTLFKRSWTGANVVYAGHNGVDGNGEDVNKKQPGWGQYEHLQPKDWPIDPSEPGMNEGYRRLNGPPWVGEALAARIMHAERNWDHDAFFAYVDRWMTEDDTPFRKIIQEQTTFPPYRPGGLTYRPYDWQRQTWYPFVMEMWQKYRDNLPPAPNGEKTPAAEVTWK
jgi:hypothetical protein